MTLEYSLQRPVFSDEQVARMRERLHAQPDGGFLVLRNAVSDSEVEHLRKFWLDTSVDAQFTDFIRNRDVDSSTPNYFYSKPTDLDRVYCCFHSNAPPDQFTHELAFQFQISRNQLEGFPTYHGLADFTAAGLQYRVCNNGSNTDVVYPHADFVEMERRDPAGSHKFDARRLQMTLILSTPGLDYDGDGFVLELNNGSEFSFGNSDVKAGDLIIWRYNNLHSVRNIQCKSRQSGFMRIIYPVFDIDPGRVGKEVCQEVGRVGGDRIVRVSDR